jgi:hypothetical protein
MGRPKGSKNKVSAFSIPSTVVTNETDEEIAIRLNRSQFVMENMANNVCQKHLSALIVSGPAGLGKTYTVEQIINKYDPNGRKTIFCKGFTRATGLFKMLWEYRHKGNVIVFDDADNVFLDIDALNLLKAACDSTNKRTIFWGAESNMTDESGELIPRHFQFEGSIIFITNFDFDRAIANDHKLAIHFSALISRSHYINLDIRSIRDYLIKMKQVIDGGMLSQRGISSIDIEKVWFFINKHQNELRELSLRMAIKLADLIRDYPTEWANFARITCFKNIS